jgi:hypothetical protein
LLKKGCQGGSVFTNIQPYYCGPSIIFFIAGTDRLALPHFELVLLWRND